jgi:glycosyltransferase 2 family protein
VLKGVLLSVTDTGFLSIKRALAIMGIGLLVFIIYFYFNIETDQITELFSQVNTVQLVLLYSLALFLIVLSVVFWAAAWQKILGKLSIKISLHKMFLTYWTGYFIDLIFPLERVGGDMMRVYLLQKQTKAKYATLASSVVTFRLVSYFVVILGLIFAAAVLIAHNVSTSIITIFFSIFAVAIVYFLILLYLTYDKRAASKLALAFYKILKFVKPNHKNDYSKLQSSLDLFYVGFQPFRKDVGSLAMPLLFHSLAYLIRIIVYVLIFYSLGFVFLPVAFFIAVYFVGSAIQDAIGSFSVGSLDIFLVTLFVLFGLDSGASGVAALLLRGADFWFPLVTALVIIQAVGVRNIVSCLSNRECSKKMTKDLKRKQKINVTKKPNYL